MRKLGPITLALVLVAACSAPPTSPDVAQAAASTSVRAQSVGAVDAQLQAVRAATARYNSFTQAEKRGYTFLFNDACFEDPELGGMGYHYVNTTLLDAAADPLAPEAMIYEPQANGSLKLVGLEYVIPGPAWTKPTPPTLFGQDYSYNAAFGLWALHVWLWKENPKGMFEPWNPTVTCANAAPATVSMEHAH